MGEVYLADDTKLGRRVSLKFLSAALQADPSGADRLLREARAAAGLNHPYICQVHEVGECHGRNFIAMEYVDGSTLRETIASGPLPLDEALRIAAEIAEALKEAHRHRIVHRDLKPANIIVSASGHIKVMDFGLAQRIVTGDPDQAETVTALPHEGAAGTLAYMSPEQLRNEVLDTRSDLFALGVILYEMLSGAHPFQKESPAVTVSAILHDTPAPVSRHCQNGPARMDDVVGRALAKNRNERYASAGELLGDLRALRLDAQSGMGATSLLPAISRRTLAALLLLLALGFVVWWSYRTFLHPPQALAFRARDWILIADLENHTGEVVRHCVDCRNRAIEICQRVPREPACRRRCAAWAAMPVRRSTKRPESRSPFAKASRVCSSAASRASETLIL